jgi:hypothetical protein
VDGNSQNISNKVRVQFNSDAYFTLVAKHPEAAPWFALSSNLLVAIDGTLYEIYE